jgi:hypothetical protein
MKYNLSGLHVDNSPGNINLGRARLPIAIIQRGMIEKSYSNRKEMHTGALVTVGDDAIRLAGHRDQTGPCNCSKFMT